MQKIMKRLVLTFLISFCFNSSYARSISSGDELLMVEDSAIGMSVGNLNANFTLSNEANENNSNTDQGTNSTLSDTPNQELINPNDPNITAYIKEWLTRAEPPINATKGAHTKYEPWGRIIGKTRTTVLNVTKKPDDVGNRSSSEYLWSLRDQLDSVNHCTLGEYVMARVGSKSITYCKNRYKTVDTKVLDEIEQKNNAMAQANCPWEYPGSVNSWNNLIKKVECVCLGSKALWNKSRSACITQKEAALESAVCNYPNSRPVWNNNLKQAMCECIPNTFWNKNKSACLTQKEAALQSAVCNYPNSRPVWNNNLKQAMCECVPNTFWNKNKSACISKQQYIPPKVVKQGHCNNANKAGGKKAEHFSFNLGGTNSFKFKYNTKTYPDRIIISQGGKRLFDSGCRGTKGTKIQQIYKNNYSSQVQVDIFPNCDGKNRTTSWNFTVVCPKKY